MKGFFSDVNGVLALEIFVLHYRANGFYKVSGFSEILAGYSVTGLSFCAFSFLG